MDDVECRSLVEWYWQGNTEVLGDTPVLVSLCGHQIPYIGPLFRCAKFKLSSLENICVQNVECSNVTSSGSLNGSCREIHLPLSVSWATWAQSTIWHLISLKSILFFSVFFYTSQVVFFPSGFPTTILRTFLYSLTCWLKHCLNEWLGVWLTKWTLQNASWRLT